VSCTRESIPTYIGVNCVVTQDKPIEILVQDIDKPSQGDPYLDEGILKHRAVLERICRDFPSVAKEFTTFTIQYPLTMSEVKCLTAISLGEESPVVIQISNISSMPLGINSDSHRVARVRIRKADLGQIGERNIVDWSSVIIRDQHGNIHPNEYVHDIDNLVPYGTEFIRFTVEFKPSATSYYHCAITATLELGSITDYSRYKAIQERTLFIQLAEEYVPDPFSSTLLVVNTMVDRETIVGWQNVIKQLFNTGLMIWNVSLYQGIDLNLRRERDGKNIIDDIAPRGKGLVIFLNNLTREPESQREYYPYYHLAKIYPLQLIKQFNIRLYIVGDMNLLM
jgi:hypothetical protein